VHFLLTTPIPSPPDTTVQSLLPDSLTPNRPHPSTTQKPIGTIRLVPDLGKVGRLVVDKEYRKCGFGKVLLCAVDDYIQGLNEEERAVMKGIIREEEGQKVAQLKLHAQVRGDIPFSIAKDTDVPDAGDPLLRQIRIPASGRAVRRRWR
jgi:GNAT superfamily N-acetyltransferase